ncbi:MAG: hypothetical protein AAGK14_14240 [Verrucomicrobiota bacterium]
MIDFNIDGPCGEGANGRVPLRVLGLGQTGIGTLDQLVLHGHNQFDLWALDTDLQTLDGSVVREKMLLGRETLYGMGASGEVELARECLIENAEELKLAASGCKHLVLLTALGGGTGAALAPHLVDLAVEDGARVIVIAATPFGFESRRRHDQAERALGRMRAHADAVLVFGNDQLLELEAAKTNLRHAFPHIDRLMSSCLDALGQMMVSDGLINLSFADMRSLFGRFAGTEVLENCWAGHGDVAAKDGAEMLVDDILASPFIPEDVLDRADNAMLCLTGGEDLSLQDVQGILEELKSRLPEDFPVAVNANMHEDCANRLRGALLLSVTRVAPEALPAAAPDELPFAEAEEIKPSTVTPVPAVSGHTQPIELPPILTEPSEVDEPAELEPFELAAAEAPAEEPAEVLAHDSLVDQDEEEEVEDDDFADAFDAEELDAQEPDWVAAQDAAPIEAASLVGPPKASPLLDAVEVPPPAAEPVADVSPELPAAEEQPPALPPKKVPELRDQLPLKHEPVILPGFAAAAGPQGELQLEQVNRGRFEKTQETIYNGENLDQPTFRRRGLMVRL